MSISDVWNRWRRERGERKAALRADEFWRWFRDNSKRPLEIQELNRRTAAYHPDVRAVLGQLGDSPELVITAEGSPAGAAHVRFLVAAQPAIPGWTVRAFKPPLSHCVVQVGPITLTPEDVEFNVIDLEHPDVGERTLLLLFVPGLAGAHSDEVRLAATRLVESMVGEERFLRWSERLVMEDREQPAEKVADIERRPLQQLAWVLNAVDEQA